MAPKKFTMLTSGALFALLATLSAVAEEVCSSGTCSPSAVEASLEAAEEEEAQAARVELLQVASVGTPEGEESGDEPEDAKPAPNGEPKGGKGKHHGKGKHGHKGKGKKEPKDGERDDSGEVEPEDAKPAPNGEPTGGKGKHHGKGKHGHKGKGKKEPKDGEADDSGEVVELAQIEDGTRVTDLEEQVSQLTLQMASMQAYIAKMESGIRSAEHLTEVQTKVAEESAANATQEDSEEESAGKCTEEDAAAMAAKGDGHGKGSFADLAASCGHESYSVWSGFDKGHYAWCLRKKHSWKLSEPCAKCFSGSAKYSYDHCKWQCLSSWCHRSCLDCAKKYENKLQDCVGVDYPVGTAC